MSQATCDEGVRNWGAAGVQLKLQHLRVTTTPPSWDRVYRYSVVALASAFLLAGAYVLGLNNRLAGQLDGWASRPAPTARSAAALSADLDDLRHWSPGSAAVWAMLAEANTIKAGQFDTFAKYAIKRSYYAAPIDETAALWRTRFVLSRWSEADAELQQAALTEAREVGALAQFRPAFQKLDASLTDAQARLALKMALDPGYKSASEAAGPKASPSNSDSKAATAGTSSDPSTIL